MNKKDLALYVIIYAGIILVAIVLWTAVINTLANL
jgi:hypothetical protein